MMDLSERIKMLREENKLTHSEVAAALKKSEGAVRSWEMKRSKPDTDTLISLAQYFKCSTDYLLGLGDFPTPKHQQNYDRTVNNFVTVTSKIANGSNFIGTITFAISRILEMKSPSLPLDAHLEMLIGCFSEMITDTKKMIDNSGLKPDDYLDFIRNYEKSLRILSHNKEALLQHAFDSLDDDTPLRELVYGDDDILLDGYTGKPIIWKKDGDDNAET